jgi:hypothetical protein
MKTRKKYESDNLPNSTKYFIQGALVLLLLRKWKMLLERAVLIATIASKIPSLI